jgi:TRAP-type uncharacterized transport system fused permease subunit
MTILKREWVYTLPLVVITIFMLTGFSPGYSAILGMATCVAISHKTKETRIELTSAWIMVLVLLGTWALKGIGATSGEATVDSLAPSCGPA